MPDADNLYTLITGASSGIGKALAIRLSGARRLILHGRDSRRLNDTLAHCANPDHHFIWPYDLLELCGLAQSLAAFMAEKGIFVECLIHSAGVLKILPIRSVDYRVLGEVMNVNFVAAVEIVSLLVKKKVNRQHLKDILLISSIASKFGAPGFSMYSASKGALDSLMRSLAVELAPRTRVNAILAGGVRTPMVGDLLADADVTAKFARDYPLGLGEPDDVVNAAEFLVSGQARWITGQALVVDGGRAVNISI
jgi:NAD(P)-dependent dehydrogenase (short-subunit alcohol dehydrogenase family)